VKTTTQTQVTHYEIQKKRRESLLEEWRGYHKTVLHRADVKMMDVPSRRMRRGVFAGRDGDRPTINLDATVHEIPPGQTSTVHRHSWDAIMFIESGSGWTEIDGVRIDWKPWDTLHLPSWAWVPTRPSKSCRRGRSRHPRCRALTPTPDGRSASRARPRARGRHG
jgi:mannose-6-phosphate isomerase-like protein (cupin superfamily)